MSTTKEHKEPVSEDKNLNISELRLSQDFHSMVGVQKALITIPVRKPNRQEFVRVRPGDEWSFPTAVLELKEERETYLVDSSLWHELPGEIVPKILYPTINRQGTFTLWPVKLPDQDGRSDQWNQSALEAAELAKVHWIRVAANMNLGAYEVFKASGDIPEPTWPDNSLEDIIKTAFKGKFVQSMEHPVIQRLLGIK
jgi:hypothetical protein